MWIYREILNNFDPKKALEAILILGPRQVGKSTLLHKMHPKNKLELYMDDIQVQLSAKKDPRFLLGESLGSDLYPIFIDEVHLAPQILSEIKRRIDEKRRQMLNENQNSSVHQIMFKMTGSNMTELDRTLKETLAGRVSLFYMLGLSLSEIRSEFSQESLQNIIFLGGFPELYVRRQLDPIVYLNDYIRTFIERDIARSAGIQKLDEFLVCLKLFSAHVGQSANFDNLSKSVGVKGKTLKEWFGVLKRNFITYSLPVFTSNLTKRLSKTPKIYFLDTGLTVRLQGHQSSNTMKNSPQMGALFENFVLTEIIKFKLNHRIDLEISYYRTKEGEEIDFVVQLNSQLLLIEAKLGTSSSRKIQFSSTTKKILGECPHFIFVTYTGEKLQLAENQYQIPVSQLDEYMKNFFIANEDEK